MGFAHYLNYFRQEIPHFFTITYYLLPQIPIYRFAINQNLTEEG